LKDANIKSYAKVMIGIVSPGIRDYWAWLVKAAALRNVSALAKQSLLLRKRSKSADHLDFNA
jgi:hypothetical protein